MRSITHKNKTHKNTLIFLATWVPCPKRRHGSPQLPGVDFCLFIAACLMAGCGYYAK